MQPAAVTAQTKKIGGLTVPIKTPAPAQDLDSATSKNNTDATSESRMSTQFLCKIGMRMKDASTVYEEDDAIEKLAIAFAYNHFATGRNRINTSTFIKFRCVYDGKKGLEENRIADAEERAKQILKFANDRDRELAEEKEEEKKNVVLTQEEQDIISEAQEVYENGEFLQYLLDTYDEYWYGDKHIMAWIAIQYANSCLENPDIGIHLHISGPSGSGKSESVVAGMQPLPPESKIVGQFTRRGLIYKISTAQPATTVLNDDHVADEDEMKLDRAILSAWYHGTIYYSVDDSASNPIPIPARINRIITNTERISKDTSGGQDESRYLTIDHSRDIETAKKIITFFQTPRKISEYRQKVCFEIFRRIKEQNWTVTIPVVDPETVFDPLQIRRVKTEMTTRRAVALLCGHTNATEEDIKIADGYLGYTRKMLSPEIPGLGTNQQILYDEIYGYFKLYAGANYLSIADLQKLVGDKLPAERFYEALRGGHGGTLESPKGGLLASVPGLYVKYAQIDLERPEPVLWFAGGVKTIPK